MKSAAPFSMLCMLLAVTLAPMALHAQTYPTKSIRATIGTPAGGPGDVVLRGAGQVITQMFGQPFVVENRVGASSILSAEACAKAVPDGHGLCSCDQQILAINPVTRTKLSYDPRDIVPIVLFGFLATGLHVHPSVPVNTLEELFALAKTKPGSIAWGSWGLSSQSHLYIEYLRVARGIQFLNVPYKAASLAWPAVLAGEVQVAYFALTTSAVQMVKSGKAKTLAVTLEQRFPGLPDVPTYKEAGLEFALVTWFGLCAPRGTPTDVILRLNTTVAKGLLNDSQMKAKFVTSQGIQLDSPAGGTPEAFAQHIAAEQQKYARIVKLTGVKED